MTVKAARTVLTTAELKPRLDALRRFLAERGAELLEPTNWELLRFRTPQGISSFYFKKNGVITFFGEAETVWLAYRKGNSSWRAMPSVKREKNNNEISTIRKRDGDFCFYCQEFVEKKEETIEHLVCLTHGGPNHISNKFLAHNDCNNHAGHLSAVEKIAIHVQAVIRTTFEEVRKSRATRKHKDSSTSHR